MKKVVFIHGFAGGEYEHTFLKKSIIDKCECFDFTYREKYGNISLVELAKRLNYFIEENVSSDIISIIGISQGGIIARYYIENLAKKKVEKCFCICSPSNGSYLAYLIRRVGVCELRPKSKFLNNLSCKKSEYYCVYTPFDLMVIPGWSSIMKNSINQRVYSLFHHLAFRSKKTIKFVRDNLLDK